MYIILLPFLFSRILIRNINTFVGFIESAPKSLSQDVKFRSSLSLERKTMNMVKGKVKNLLILTMVPVISPRFFFLSFFDYGINYSRMTVLVLCFKLPNFDFLDPTVSRMNFSVARRERISIGGNSLFLFNHTTVNNIPFD